MSSRTRIKVCGLTRPEDIHAAAAAGVDAIGLVFYPRSRRAVSIEQAIRLREQVPAFVSLVALVVNAQPADIEALVHAIHPDLLQFHGDETPNDCRRYGRPYLRAIRVGGPGTATAGEVLDTAMAYHDAAGWLFDTHSQAYGGTGTAFDYSLLDDVVAHKQARPWVLAGGLNAASVPAAIARLQPYAVDVSSGVEQAPGIKSAEQIQQFVRAVRQADGTQGAA